MGPTSQLLSIAITLAFLTGCTSGLVRPTLSPGDVARQERSLGEILVPGLSARLPAVQDMELQVYLRRILETLAMASPELRDSPLGIQLYRDSQQRLTSYSIPGTRVFLSAQVLKVLRYESELASLLAYELSLLESGVLLARLGAALEIPELTAETLKVKLPNDPPFLGADGYFDFPLEARRAALKRAVGILYDAGYDPRGILALIDAWKEAGKKSPWPLDELTDARIETRAELNTFPPLRNPVVRSEEFVKMLKRIERL